MQATVLFAHQQNGKIKQYIRTLEDTYWTLMADANAPPSFWGDVVLTAQYLQNRLSTSTLPGGLTPLEALDGVKLDLSML